MKKNNILLSISIFGFIFIALGSLFICIGSILKHDILLTIGLVLVILCVIIEVIILIFLLIKFYKSYR